MLNSESRVNLLDLNSTWIDEDEGVFFCFLIFNSPRGRRRNHRIVKTIKGRQVELKEKKEKKEVNLL
jgi:hypothetical protein